MAATAVVAFGAFLGLTAVNVVGVTAHGTTLGGQSAANTTASAALTLAPGDFFGLPGSAVSVNTSGVAQPPLLFGGGSPMLSSGGS
jgi:hypothetical protein